MSLAYDQTPTKRPGDATLTDEQAQLQREDKLVRLLKSYEEDALGYAQSEIIEQQIEALARYFGEKYGDEEEGRSQITTREVLEGIEWTRPDLARVFSSGGNVVTVEEQQPEDARYSKDAADYMSWIFFHDNPGYENLDDFAFDGLLHRRGYLACYWRDAEYQAPQTLTGLNIMQVAQLHADKQVEIIGQDFDNEHSEVGGITLVIKRQKSPARAEIVSIAPEDMRLNGRSVTIEQHENLPGSARYVGRVHRMLRGEAARMWPDKEAEIFSFKSGQAGMTGAVRRAEDVRQERFQDDRNDIWRSHAMGDDASTELEILEEYIRADLNDDGYPELIRSYRMGDVILEESEVADNPFGTWTPVRVPHRFMGLSFHELLADLQRQSTVITRAGLDALYQAVVNREAYDKNKVDLDTLLSTYSGSKVAVDGAPADSIMPLVGGLDTAGRAWEALEIIKQRIEDRVGASRQTRGLDADRLTGDHSGKALQLLQINADARKEMVARNMAIGLGAFFTKLYKLVCRNQNQPRAAKVGGKWAQFDPRVWNSELRVSIHSGGVNREHTLMGLQLIGAEQDKVLEFAGAGNPNVTVKNRYAYQEELCRQVGWKDASPFFTEVPDQPVMGPDGQPVIDPETGQPKMQPYQPPPQPDPAMAKVQADAQAAQATHQLKTEETVATITLQKQKDEAELQTTKEEAALKLQIMRETAANEQRLAEAKAAAEAQLAQDKADREYALAVQQAEREYQLALLEIESKERIAKAQLEHQREMHTEKIDATAEMHTEKVDADIKMSKNRPGGKLDE